MVFYLTIPQFNPKSPISTWTLYVQHVDVTQELYAVPVDTFLAGSLAPADEAAQVDKERGWTSGARRYVNSLAPVDSKSRQIGEPRFDRRRDPTRTLATLWLGRGSVFPCTSRLATLAFVRQRADQDHSETLDPLRCERVWVPYRAVALADEEREPPDYGQIAPYLIRSRVTR